MDGIVFGRRALTALDLILIAVAAYLAGQIILALAVPPPVDVDTAGRGAVYAVRDQDRQWNPAADAEAVLSRNLFGSRVTASEGGAEAAPVEGTEALPESDLPLSLLGTVVHVSGDRSFAIIQENTSREQNLYYPGDAVIDGVTVQSVGRNRVVLLRGGRVEVLEKTEERVAAPPRRRPTRARPTAAAAKKGADITVRKVAENSFVMDRREVEGVLQDFNKLLTQVRVVPHFANGEPDGFKIFNIRPNSLFMKMGMVNGDIIKRVNGLEISGPEQALQMFQQLKDESRITLDLERFRKNLTLQYEIR